MKISFLNFLLKLWNDESGNISLTGNDPGDAGPDPVGDGAGVEGDGGAGDDPAVSLSGDTPVSDPLASLDADVKEDPSLKVFLQDDGSYNYANLMKSYVHAQRKMGEKGVHLPTDASSDEDWQNFYNMVRPAELDKYELKNSVEEGEPIDESLFNGFREVAHKSGMAPKQAQSVLDWFNNTISESQKQSATQSAEAYEKEAGALKAEWGDAFDRQMNLAQRAVQEFADEPTLKFLKDSGLDQNVTLIRLFNKIGHGLMEDKFDQESHGTFGVTKDEAERKMAAIQGDPSHPYWNADHAQHRFAVEEMQKLVEATLR